MSDIYPQLGWWTGWWTDMLSAFCISWWPLIFDTFYLSLSYCNWSGPWHRMMYWISRHCLRYLAWVPWMVTLRHVSNDLNIHIAFTGLGFDAAMCYQLCSLILCGVWPRVTEKCQKENHITSPFRRSEPKSCLSTGTFKPQIGQTMSINL